MLVNYINDQSNILLSYYFSEYHVQSNEFIKLRDEWLSKESSSYQSLLFTSSKSDLGNKKVNEFLNKWYIYIKKTYYNYYYFNYYFIIYINKYN